MKGDPFSAAAALTAFMRGEDGDAAEMGGLLVVDVLGRAGLLPRFAEPASEPAAEDTERHDG